MQARKGNYQNSKDESNSPTDLVLKSLQPTSQKSRAIQSCHPTISRRGPQAKGGSTQPSHTAQCGHCGLYQILRNRGHILFSPSVLAGTTLFYLYPTAGKPKLLHSSQLPFLKTSQIQLRHEVKNSCDGVRRGVQSPRTHATAGNQLGPGTRTLRTAPVPPGQYPGDSLDGGSCQSLANSSHWHLLLFSDLVEEFHVLYHGICWPVHSIMSISKYCGGPWCVAT